MTRLQTYGDARAAAPEIRREVLAGTMPPWPALSGVADYSNDRTLTPLEVAVISSWAEGGTPLGPEVRARHPISNPVPALRLLAPTSPQQGFDRYVLSSDQAKDLWIRAWRFVPGDPRSTQRAILRLPAMLIGQWTPPDETVEYPPDVGIRLPARARIVLEVFRDRSASAEAAPAPDSIELYVGGRPRRELHTRALECGDNLVSSAIDVLSVRPEAAVAGATECNRTSSIPLHKAEH